MAIREPTIERVHTAIGTGSRLAPARELSRPLFWHQYGDLVLPSGEFAHFCGPAGLLDHRNQPL